MSLFREWKLQPHDARAAAELAVQICEEDIYPSAEYAPDPARLDYVMQLCQSASAALQGGGEIDQRLAQEISRLARDIAQWRAAGRLNVPASFKYVRYAAVKSHEAVPLTHWRLTVQLTQPEESSLTYRGAALSVAGRVGSGQELLTASIEALQYIRFPKTKRYQDFPRRSREQLPSRQQLRQHRAEPISVIVRAMSLDNRPGQKYRLLEWNRAVSAEAPNLMDQRTVDAVVQRGFEVYGFPLDAWALEQRGRDLWVRGVAFRTHFEEVQLVLAGQQKRSVVDTMGTRYELIHPNQAWFAAQPPAVQRAIRPPPEGLPDLRAQSYISVPYAQARLPALPGIAAEPRPASRVRFGAVEEQEISSGSPRSRSPSPKRKAV